MLFDFSIIILGSCPTLNHLKKLGHEWAETRGVDKHGNVSINAWERRRTLARGAEIMDRTLTLERMPLGVDIYETPHRRENNTDSEP